MPASSPIRSSDVDRATEEVRVVEGVRNHLRGSLIDRARAARKRLSSASRRRSISAREV